MSSRLFQEVRERQGWRTPFISASILPRQRLFYVYAGTDAANFGKVVKALMKELRLLKKDGISADELAVEDHLRATDAVARVDLLQMNRLARQEMRFGSFLSIDAMLAAIDGVRPRRVETMLHRVLDESQLALLALLGPIERGRSPRELAAPSVRTHDLAIQPARDGAHLDPGREVWRLAPGGAGGLRGLCSPRPDPRGCPRPHQGPGGRIAGRIDEIEATTRHDVIAFLTNLEERSGPTRDSLTWA